MPAVDDLIEECWSAPDDDAPRLVWADAVGGERGELVVIQCELARGDLAPAKAGALRRRERELLAVHGRKWAGLGALPVRFEFRRGFVEAIQLGVVNFVEESEEIFRRAPLVRSFTATWGEAASGDPIHELRRLVELPTFSRLHGLHLRDFRFEHAPGWVEGRGDEAVRVLIESGALARLHALGIWDSDLSTAGVKHLGASGELGRLEKLWLCEGNLGRDAVITMLGRAPRLKSLDLSGAVEFVSKLPPVAELVLSGVFDGTLAALGTSRAAATVETLRLSGILDGFYPFPRLHTLDFEGHGRSIGGAQPGDSQGMGGVAALPSLRRLRFSYHDPESALHVARTWGPQLEELVLWGEPGPSVLAQLQEYVAGEVRSSAKPFAATLL